MRVLFHPEFPRDVQRFKAEYLKISLGLATRFQDEVTTAVEAVKLSPLSAGHILETGSAIVRELRRRNLQAFPFFILYGLTESQLVFGS